MKKKRIPRHINPSGGLAVFGRRKLMETLEISLTNPLPAATQNSIAADYYLAVGAFTSGMATEYHFGVITAALNTSAGLVKQGLGDEYSALLEPALAALRRARVRHDKTGKYGFDGEGLQAIRDAAELHEAHLAVATRYDLARVIREMDPAISGGYVLERLHKLPEAA